MRGVLWYSFGNFKLAPDDLAADAGGVINVAVEDENVPGSFALRQNYPNPFNPVTTIRYQVGELAQVKLEVFDVLGRRVATLFRRPTGPRRVRCHVRSRPVAQWALPLPPASRLQSRNQTNDPS